MLAAVIVVALIFCTLPFAVDYQRNTGHVLYGLMLTAGLVAVAMAGERATNIFADERRNGTLGILFLTGIRPVEVLIGKLSALVVVPLSWLATLLPGLVIAWLFRGVSMRVCFTTLVLLGVLLAFALSLNLLASLLFEEQSSARTFADGTLIALIGIVPFVNWLNGILAGGALPLAVQALSPAAAIWMLFADPRTPNFGLVDLSIAYNAIFALVLFACSTWMVGRAWKDKPESSVTHGLPKAWRRFLRRMAGTRLLDRNPYQWLIVRDAWPALVTWSILAALISLWILGWIEWRASWLNPINFWVSFLLLSGIVRWMINYIGARRVGLDRASGTLELMLTTGLSVDEIIGGQKAAVRRYCRPLFVFFAVLAVTLYLGGLLAQPIRGQALFNYTVFWLGVAFFGPWSEMNSFWTAFWISLNTGRPGFAMRKQLLQKAGFTSLYIQIFLNRNKLSGIPSGGYAETRIAVIVLGCGVIGAIVYWIVRPKMANPFEQKAREHLRGIAAEPLLDTGNSRLKKWDMSRPLHAEETLEIDHWMRTRGFRPTHEAENPPETVP